MAGGAGSAWQAGDGRAAAALREVFAWLSGAELARAGAACRAWRAAAGDPALWRRLLAARAPARTLRALRRHRGSLSWRQEYVDLHARWKLRARLTAPGDEPLLHAALADGGRRLAVTSEDGLVTIWDKDADGTWSERCGISVREQGWARAERAVWAAGGARLLVAGPLALAARWELLVLRVSAGGACGVLSRAGCSAGAAGCWARPAGDAFLSLELSRLAPGQACTTVWLNAATQEIQSEYAGVTAPLLRIYNEDSGHITHAVVVEVPLEEPLDDDAVSSPTDDGQLAPGEPYYRATCASEARGASVQTLVAASYGESGIVRTWPLAALQPPPLLAAALGDLRQRRRAREHRPSPPPAPPAPPAPPEPDEAAVRALCTPPDSACRLHAAVLGIVPHPGYERV
ncbi:F-box/WD repeat-containing protein 5-like [Achroia grisella]|uniref:F-box/WD repeat-containing protein 5-like n=1 Tax=Achroia grisella TaxID=688607 RepID=UPI0027D26489|nr:F-box/WD repeat-containing protein 5-like [Achroia grisella]